MQLLRKEEIEEKIRDGKLEEFLLSRGGDVNAYRENWKTLFFTHKMDDLHVMQILEASEIKDSWSDRAAAALKLEESHSECFLMNLNRKNSLKNEEDREDVWHLDLMPYHQIIRLYCPKCGKKAIISIVHII